MKKISFIFLTFFCLSTSKPLQAQSEVTFYTSMGTFVAEMYDTLQPITTSNFLGLVFFQFYDGIIFHRVIDGFMIQGGDPLGTGFGGPGWTIQDEFDPNTSNVQKAISMANAGPNTGGSQFFINLVNNLNLDPNYPVFGMVTSNFSVVQDIGQVAVNGSNRPLTPVVMDSVRVTMPFVTAVDPQSAQAPLIEIYPNPVSDNSAIKIQGKSNRFGSFSIFNQLGTEVFNREIELNGETHTLAPEEINRMNLSSGIYFLVVSDGVSIARKKFMVVK